MMEIRDICFQHSHTHEAVLKNITLQAERGRLTSILGPNGSGKTTLFKCIAGLWMPNKGDVFFEGGSILGYSHDKRAKIIAVVPQEHEPPFPYSVFDAVLMGRAAHVDIFSAPSKKDFAKAEEAIEEVGIGHLKERPYTKISGGERQLALIARALAQETPVMLFDEPTSHLDFRNQVLVLSKVKEIVRQRQVIAVLTMHDPNLTMLFSDSVVIINGGSVVAQGSAKEVIDEVNLKRIYGIDVSVISVNGTRVVTPKLTAKVNGYS
jgi:iron complex transport system ATP-binding protein